jgi:hypothetical protein
MLDEPKARTVSNLQPAKQSDSDTTHLELSTLGSKQMLMVR